MRRFSKMAEVSGAFPVAGLAATAGAAVLGPVVGSYTSVLFANTAVRAWHDARHELPFLFVSSAGMAASGLGLVAAGVVGAIAAVRYPPVRRLSGVMLVLASACSRFRVFQAGMASA
jgi:hypothetical protein